MLLQTVMQETLQPDRCVQYMQRHELKDTNNRTLCSSAVTSFYGGYQEVKTQEKGGRAVGLAESEG